MSSYYEAPAALTVMISRQRSMSLPRELDRCANPDAPPYCAPTHVRYIVANVNLPPASPRTLPPAYLLEQPAAPAPHPPLFDVAAAPAMDDFDYLLPSLGMAVYFGDDPCDLEERPMHDGFQGRSEEPPHAPASALSLLVGWTTSVVTSPVFITCVGAATSLWNQDSAHLTAALQWNAAKRRMERAAVHD